MNYQDKDRQAWEWLMNPGAAPDEGIDLDRLAGELNMSSYGGEATPPPANPHARVDAVASEAAREAAKELAARKRSAAESAAKDALAAGATAEQAQEAARAAVAALETEAQGKAAQYAAEHPEHAPASSAAPGAATDEDELAAFERALAGDAPAPAEGTDDQEATTTPTPDLGDLQDMADAREHEQGLRADYSDVPSLAQPLVQDMVTARINPSDHRDLLEEAGRIAAAGVMGTITQADLDSAQNINSQLTKLGIDPYFT